MWLQLGSLYLSRRKTRRKQTEPLPTASNGGGEEQWQVIFILFARATFYIIYLFGNKKKLYILEVYLGRGLSRRS